MKNHLTLKISYLKRASLANLMTIGVISLSLFFSCNHANQSNMKEKAAVEETSSSVTFQELGFFGNIKEDQWDQFVQAVQNNVANSRNEPGNLSFSLYQPENVAFQAVWFERFTNKSAHTYHKEQDYFKNAISVIQASLAGEARSIELKELDDIPAQAPLYAKEPGKSRHVVVLFDVKAERKTDYITAMREVASHSRKAAGNLEFNLYQFAHEPNQFALIESWENKEAHEAQQKQEYLKKLQADLEGVLVSNPMDQRWVLKDISQKN